MAKLSAEVMKSPKIMVLIERYLTLQQYIKTETQERDWHAVSDAANDLREMEAKHPWLRSVHGKVAITRTG